MLSRRKEILRDTNNIEDSEEILISDSEANEVFQLNTGKSKSKKQLNLREKKHKKEKCKDNEKNEPNKEKTTIEIQNNYDSDEELRLILSEPYRKRKQSLTNLIEKSKNKNNQIDDGIIYVSSEESNSEIINCSDDDCIIDLDNSKLAKKLTRSKRSLRSAPSLFTSIPNSSSTAQQSDSSFNSSFDNFQLDPETFSSIKFVKTIRLKFKYQGSYKCVIFKSNDKFKDKLDELSQVLEKNASLLLLMFDGKPISFESTPDDLNIGICDIIDVYDKTQDLNSRNQEDDKEDPNLFKLKFRDCDSRRRNEDKILTMNRYDTFEQIFKKFADLKGLDLNKVTFEFDGDKIGPNQKPDDLDMESDSLIDVKIKN